jgi:hypothetical protein
LIERALADLFHDALDHEDVSAPFQRLQTELEKPGAARRRAGRRIFMTRNRLVLLAAALVLVLGISVVVSARLLGARPVGQTINAGPDKTTVARLLARPLNLKHFTKSNDCLDGPYTNGSYGAGPIYGGGGGYQDTSWGTYWTVSIRAEAGTKGPIVFRGQDVILGWPLVFVSNFGTGDVYGTDELNGKSVNQYTALAIDEHAPSQGVLHWWFFQQGFKHGWSGCVGFQADGPNFSETFYSAGPGT